ncbi:MAG: cell division protein FtsA [Candidatus Tectomicrobia bacterium]|uniref:Cell division protein FtsA n=1 Tax=Tectimicrobiota bacterium TaxID=2528274 RepID=A0A932CRX2_UNCTE|nr:cell division protein FtsA [Candidatus Tectomicrobia bacterium]
MFRENLVVGLDIGTTKICAIIGERKGDDQVEILGVGICPCNGLKKGVIVNIESTVNAVRHAVQEAELVAGAEVKSVYVGIAGSHINGANSHGVVAIKNKEVRRTDTERVLDAACAMPMPMGREVIHVLPQEYVVDDQGGIKEPAGISGTRLEGKVHIVTGSVTSTHNIRKCVQKANLEARELVLEPLASSEATLTVDEKELGVALVDIGGGTSDILVFTQGSTKHTAVLPLGGDHITRDIAIGLRTPLQDAERIKKRYGCAYSSMIEEDEMIEVPSIGGRDSRKLSRKVLSEIVESRAEEIFRRVDLEIRNSGYKDLLASGVVITGGSSIMEGMQEIAEEILELPVRRGLPMGIKGLVDMVNSPLYATAVGLVLYGMKREAMGSPTNNNGVYQGIQKFIKGLGKFFSAVLALIVFRRF